MIYPYGVTNYKWDKIIDIKLLWQSYERIIKDNGAIVLFGVEPFSTYLRNSNLKLYKYDLKWIKNTVTGFQFCNCQPLRKYEDILVFSKGGANNGAKNPMKYNPQKENNKYPTNILYYPKETKHLHPTQKPIKLLEYLIKTYSNENDLILDNCMGSGSTAVACINTNRNFIGFEKDLYYYNLSLERIGGVTNV